MKKKITRKTQIYLLVAAIIWLITNGIAIYFTPILDETHWIGLILGNIVFLVTLAYLTGVFQLNQHLPKMSELRIKRYYRYSFWILAFGMFLIPFFFMIHLPDSLHLWDYFTIFNSTTQLHGQPFGTYNTHMSYYLRYPNNQFFGIVFNQLFAGVASNIFFKNLLVTGTSSLLTSLGLLAMSQTVKNLSGVSLALLFNVAAFGFLPFYFYGAQLYTDTVTLPFIALAVLFFVKSWQAKSAKYQLIWASVASCVTVVGYIFKPTVAIVFIAALVFLIINKKWRKTLVVLALFLAFWGVGHSFTQATIASQSGFSQKAQIKYNFPMMHWIMMSWSPKSKDGGFNLSLREYTQSISGKTAKNKADTQLFLSNIEQMGVGGIIHQIGRKLAYTWTFSDLNSSFYTYRHANPLVYHYFDYLPNKKTGNITGWLMLKAAEMLFWLPLVLLLWKQIFTQLFSPNKWSNPWSFLMIIILGLSLFLILWEANSRYLYSFAPILIAIAIYQVHELTVKTGK
ncbi:glycosyltransferase family 39 protein [Lactococcus nasutitermitis]|uniref:Glycosyltransferase family 39 protein n=1 Tax=Lactococcus nasutitermitis TaxID=1652957 RepID=A0ABV9JB38_9LACT|nr:glycosyltransferase family 39 protein [Lactococcus nasutitermitis]